MRSFRNLSIALLLSAGLAQADTVVIAALGDSLTQGYGLAPDQGLVPRLEAWLSDQGADVRMINAGVSGDTTAGGLARIGWTLTPDVQGVIVALGANDMLRGLDPGEARANLDGILHAISTAGATPMLVGFEAPLNFGADYKATFDSAYPELADSHNAVFLPNLLAPLQNAERPVAELLQSDRLHPNPEGVELIVGAMGPTVLDFIDRISSEAAN